MKNTEPRAIVLRQLQIEEELLRRRARTSLYHFTRYAWPVIEQGVPFVDGWHIKVICDHLQSVFLFQTKKLIINIPPRHMKSTLTAVMFPAWVWGLNPHASFIYGSHSQGLAVRDSMKTRTLIESERYKKVFNPAWQLAEDENQKMIFRNTLGGFRKAVGVGGGITGEGADYLMVDDPLGALDAISEVEREKVKYWYDNVLASRVNNPKRNAKVIIMQRLHEDDLSGHLLKKGDYDHLVLPAEFNPSSDLKSSTRLGFVDPRTEPEEPLWPAQWGKAEILESKKSLEVNAHAQLNQEPRAPGGGLFPPECWGRYEVTPSDIQEIVQFIDAAQKPGLSNDYSVIATWARTVNAYYLLDLWRGKVDTPILQAKTEAYYSKWTPKEVVIEDKSAGSSLIQYLLRSTTIPVIPYNPGRRDKEVRATAATPLVKMGKCFLPLKPIMELDVEQGKEIDLVKAFIKEHENFPKSKHDDMVDTTSMLVEYFSKRTSNQGPRVRSLA